MENTVNRIILRGTLSGAPAFSHENHGRRFYRFALEVPRLSGTADTLRVLAPEPLLGALEVCEADYVEVSGQIRSFNNRLESGRKLLVSVYATELRLCGRQSIRPSWPGRCASRPYCARPRWDGKSAT